MKSSLGSASAGSPNWGWPASDAVVVATATRVGSGQVPVVPSSAVARNTAVPAASAVMTPNWSTVAMSGVSDDQVNVVVTVALLAVRSVANSWAWNPTGSAGSLGARPLKLSEFGGGGAPAALHAPNELVDGPDQWLNASRCSDWPTGVFDGSWAMMSVDTTPFAGPPTAV